MTEAEWLTTFSPDGLLANAGPARRSQRRMRLLAVALGRFGSANGFAPPDHDALEVAELFADGRVGEDVRRLRFRARRGDNALASAVLNWHGLQALYATLRAVGVATYSPGRNRQDLGAMCELVRDVVGNPFRPVGVESPWRTFTAVALARQVYESRDFSPMPILADALQDAGCEDADVLDHCRSSQVHVRGCWVVDMVLGKE